MKRTATTCIVPALAALCVGVSGCASVSGYPKDPANPAVETSSFQGAFSASVIEQYSGITDPAAKKAYRDKIVMERLASYDVQFAVFERNLASQRNSFGLLGGLSALALSGLSTTVAGEGAKTALSAASTGVQGATAEVNKDLFYSAALPALLAQMEANRATVLIDIVKGLADTDGHYPLPMALHDLDRYANAGSIPAALSVITQSATDIKQSSDADVTALRSQTYQGDSTTTLKLVAWLFPNGDQTLHPIPANLAALTNWMQSDQTDPKLSQLPYEMLLNGSDPSLEPDRSRAVAALINSSGGTP